MSNNVRLNSPTTTGALIATDEVGSAQHQLMKIEFGGDGVATKVSAADPLPTADTAVLAKLSNDPATGTKQDTQTALLTTLNSLIETNNTLIQLLSPLAAAMNAGAPALRVAPISSQSTAVTGTLTGVTTVTTVSTLTNFGTGIPAKEMADDMNNLVATMANINNVTA